MDNLHAIENNSGFRVGRFVSESKNRFLCTVQVDGAEETCYIASSCRLDNFIDLHGKEVLLRRNTGKNVSTQYAVLGVKHKRNYVLLNTSWANKAIANSIHGRRFSFIGTRKNVKKEVNLHGYRADFYIDETKTIIEVKSVISTFSTAKFPTVFSERTLRQLDDIEDMLYKDYKAYFFIISLNPYVREIRLLKDTECYDHLKRCINKGLVLRGFACQLSITGEPYIKKEIPILID